MPTPWEHQAAVDDTQAWLERAVIGLNLCPFAKAVHVKGQVRYEVSAARDGQQLTDDLLAALQRLVQSDSSEHDTTLLIVPWLLQDFLDFNDYLGEADDAVERLGLAGEIQIASFHPRYRFAGTRSGDIGNYTNRSPYPILQLLRETSIDKAVEAFPEPEEIYETNIATLRELGLKGWEALELQARVCSGPPASGTGGADGQIC